MLKNKNDNLTNILKTENTIIDYIFVQNII